MRKIIPILILFFLLLIPAQTLAKLGVGVNVGKIEVEQDLRSGGIYKLPAIAVINTGDEEADYTLEVTYHEGQKELRPRGSWFSFSPSKFHLKGGESQMVGIKLKLPLFVKPGNYFAYLEAHPIRKEGQVTIGIAAATKLYFKIVPQSFFQAFYFKILTFYQTNAPTSYIVTLVILLWIIYAVLRRYFSLRLIFKKK